MALVFECPRRGIGFSESGASAPCNERPATGCKWLQRWNSGATHSENVRKPAHCWCRPTREARCVVVLLRNPIHSHQKRTAPLPLCDLPIANPQIGITSKRLVN